MNMQPLVTCASSRLLSRCPPPAAPLPRPQASLTGLPPLPPPKGRSTFVVKTAGWFITTLLLGILAVGGLVLLAFGPPPAGAAPAARTGSALAMLPAAGNASQRLVVYSGLGQTGFLFKDVHTFDLKSEWRKIKSKDLEVAAPPPWQLQPHPPPQQRQQPQPQQQWEAASHFWWHQPPRHLGSPRGVGTAHHHHPGLADGAPGVGLCQGPG